MYITISPQKTGGAFPKSSAGFVSYLEKENEGKSLENQEFFFNQEEDRVDPETVIQEIDGNTAKLKSSEPKFYSVTLNPSAYELKNVQSNEQLKAYTREVMKAYAQSFNRDIDGRPVNVNDLKYFAKLETQRTYKGTDWKIKENQPYATRILKLKNEMRRIRQGEQSGNLKSLQQQMDKLEREAPHQLNGQRITQGMPKEGNQAHIHIIISRKDASNRYSLSPGSKYKASQVVMNGKMVQRGFDRDHFFKQAEKVFDQKFGYRRNFVESYQARKMFLQQPKNYLQQLAKLPTPEKRIAFRMLRAAGLPNLPSIPTNKVQLALKTFKSLKRGVEIALKSGSIGI
ncbi:MobB family relaxase [Autumnicola musiva]|uniref:MobB family relaxase n=1 Tax=Autumnicola musiva TaxID=3075589 RepID=A0ABU3D8R7_9FLAO|nr:MobB family relaxase [Zunongwangia sp. F117]MDT0677912.1 MobB family relaxase [Zunongwangia sp. F117]